MMTSTFSPSKPEYYLYTFPDDVDSVVVKAVSDDSRCMILSVQDTKVCNSPHSLSIHVYILVSPIDMWFRIVYPHIKK